jgi:UDP-3-O-[3-hydroxymyristoyl] N-acetylglucosamine deacetylase / 3-hydroxyacyl-[acyl-carrier-protein] dehydratase
MPWNRKQTTINGSAELSGAGMFSGQPCTLRFGPAEPDTGIVFTRIDLGEPIRITASVANLAPRARRTTLRNGTATIETVEHVLSAANGLGVDNLMIEVSGPEIPNHDGSPQPFVEKLLAAGIKTLDAEAHVHIVREPLTVKEGDAMLAALPGATDGLEVLYDLDYSSCPSVGRQVFAFRLGQDDYVKQLAPARTFLLSEEAQHLRSQGMGPHLTEQDVLVMGPEGPVSNQLRFPDEHVRHKVCDLIGDLALLGRRLSGRILACRSGHTLNHQLVQRLTDQLAASQRRTQAMGQPLLDIRAIQRILPHRFPFLMIDRVIEVDGDRRAVAVKNVTMNEPFFQGHYPGHPIMPGVLVLEAMAQLSGVLLSRRLDNTGKVAMLVSMDKVRIRRAAMPGDQLIIEAEALHVRSRTGHCRCRATIGEHVAATAEIVFMLVDEDAA